MQELADPKKIVDSICDGALSALQFFPRAAQNIAANATAYASSVNSNLNSIKAGMPDDPAVIPRAIGSVLGETLGAGIGMLEAVIGAGSDTAREVSSQIKRTTS